MAVEGSSFACQTPRSMASTRTDFSTDHTCMAPNIGSVLRLIHSRATFTIMMFRVPYVTLGHVHLSWWCPQGMTVLPVGPRSIMDTWCHGTFLTGNPVISFALTQTQSLFTEVTRESMVPCCTSWKVRAARYHAYRTLTAESWLAHFAPSETKKGQEKTQYSLVQKNRALCVKM